MEHRRDYCLSVQRVSKKFSRSLKRSYIYGVHDVLRTVFTGRESATLRESEFWALKDVSFDLPRGRSIGVVGLNGSGKSTLMRMIAGVLRPTTGTIDHSGRIAPMLALGAGFKPVLSGRENVFLNLSLLGVAPTDIRDRFAAIVEFAELLDSIDAPLGTYSSGQLARLGFACAVHTEPQILVIDEVLSVGDAKFRSKCRNRINEMRKAGTSILLVSHSAITVETLCDECIYLRQGLVAARGRTEEVLKTYESDTLQEVTTNRALRTIGCVERVQRTSSQLLRIDEVCVTADGASSRGSWINGKPAELVVSIQCAHPLDKVSVNVMIVDLTHQAGETVQFMTSHRDMGWLHLEGGEAELRLSLLAVGLRPGSYRMKVSVSQGEMHDILDALDEIKLIVHDIGLATNCLYFQPRDWMVVGGRVTDIAEQHDGYKIASLDDV